MRGRLIAIGDIHGCAREFEELMDKVDLRKDDRLVLLGDLVNRGPESRRVVELARRHATVSLLGNHELRLLNWRKTDDPSHLKAYDYATIEQLDNRCWDYLARMPLTYEDRKSGLVFVHGGFLPGRPWRTQPARVVTRIQVIGRDGEPHKRSDAPGCPHWARKWRGPAYVVYGHTPRRRIVATRWTLGIDTGCVLGGLLTAVIFPGRKIVQVKAHKTYFQGKNW